MIKYRYVYLLIILCLVLSIFCYKKFLPVSGERKRVIVIDPGHGGKDPGTSSGKAIEKDIVLNISKVLYNTLKKKYKVYMTRDGDYDLSSPNVNLRKRSDFDNRIKFINQVEADVYLSIHLNYYSNSKYYGAQVFFDSINDENKILANIIQDKLNINNSNRSIKEINDLYLYKNLERPGVLIECGFISNSTEKLKLQDPEYQKVLSEKIMEALEIYFH